MFFFDYIPTDLFNSIFTSRWNGRILSGSFHLILGNFSRKTTKTNTVLFRAWYLSLCMTYTSLDDVQHHRIGTRLFYFLPQSYQCVYIHVWHTSTHGFVHSQVKFRFDHRSAGIRHNSPQVITYKHFHFYFHFAIPVHTLSWIPSNTTSVSGRHICGQTFWRDKEDFLCNDVRTFFCKRTYPAFSLFQQHVRHWYYPALRLRFFFRLAHSLFSGFGIFHSLTTHPFSDHYPFKVSCILKTSFINRFINQRLLTMNNCRCCGFVIVSLMGRLRVERRQTLHNASTCTRLHQASTTVFCLTRVNRLWLWLCF